MKSSLSFLGQAVVLEPATSNDNVIQPLVDSAKGLVIRQHSSSQSGALLELQGPAGSVLGGFDASGNLVGGAASPSGSVILAPNTPTRNTIQPTADTNLGLIIQGHSATQSAKLLSVRSSAGDELTFIGQKVGGITCGGAHLPTPPLHEYPLAVVDPIAGLFSLIVDQSGFGTGVQIYGYSDTDTCLLVSPTTNGPVTADVFQVWGTGGLSLAFSVKPTGATVMAGDLVHTGSKAGFLGAAAVVRQTNGTAAALAAITDANAKSFLTAVSTALVNLGLLAAPA